MRWTGGSCNHGGWSFMISASDFPLSFYEFVCVCFLKEDIISLYFKRIFFNANQGTFSVKVFPKFETISFSGQKKLKMLNLFCTIKKHLWKYRLWEGHKVLMKMINKITFYIWAGSSKPPHPNLTFLGNLGLWDG